MNAVVCGASAGRKGREWMVEPGRFALPRRFALLAGLVVLGVVLYARFGDVISLMGAAERESELRALQAAHPVLVYLAGLAVYVLITGLSLPGAAGLTLLYGWFFGFGPGVVVVILAATTGATCAFVLSRHLFRDSVQERFADRLTAFNRALAEEGAFYLFTLRLIPAVPFFVINVVMGLTPLRARTFFWISLVGMLPGTCVYVYAGSAVPDLQMLADQGVGAVLSPGQLAQIVSAFVLLGVFPLLVKKLVTRARRG